MRLATFNILHGRSLADGCVSTERLTEACASLDADVLCLQEVDRHQGRSDSIDQTAAVARAMRGAAWRFEPALIGEPGGRWRAALDRDAAGETGEVAGYGVGLVSRRPVRAWRVLRLAAAPIRSPVAVPRAASQSGRSRVPGVILLPDEPRVALVAEVEAPGGPLLVATTHLSFVPGWNVRQLRRLTRTLAGSGRPSVLAGDLNLPGPVPRWVTGWRRLATLPTFPAAKPSLQIDHVLGFGDLPEVVGAATRELRLSDHRAVVVDLAD